MLNDMCLLIHQIKICQPQKISDSPNFNPSKYTCYTVFNFIFQISKEDVDNYCDNKRGITKVAICIEAPSLSAESFIHNILILGTAEPLQSINIICAQGYYYFAIIPYFLFFPL